MPSHFNSEIRDSQINALLEKAANRNYLKYLPKLSLKKIRGFENEPVSFDFPVTAVIGPNGGGKSTILGAAALPYLSVAPRRFFAKSGKYDESMQDWSIDYELIDREVNERDSIRRGANFKNLRWNRDALARDVLIFGVSRTVPANERSELARCATRQFAVPEENVKDLGQQVAESVSKILGKNVSNYKEMVVSQRGSVKLLTGEAGDGAKYSEFHFGAGESSIIRMVIEIESAPDQSLVLIEEIENGLHPVATVRLVEYLVEVAERKKIQVVFTTHSNDALRILPSKAVWVATQDRIFQGKLDVESLRAITGHIETGAVVFVEDQFAQKWVEALIRQSDKLEMDKVEVHAMEGDGTAVSFNRYHNQDPSLDAASICIIDGDSLQEESLADSVYRLPGEMPESFIFDSVLEEWGEIGGRISVALLQPFEKTAEIKKVCTEVRTTNRDPHLLFAQLGERLGFIPEQTVQSAFLNIWVQQNLMKLASLIDAIDQAIIETDAQRDP